MYMSVAPPRRARRSDHLAPAAAAAAPSPDTPPPARLLDLPTELLARVFSRFDGPLDIARVAAVSHLFHASLAVEGIRLWAQERGFELPAQPEDESCAVRWLCFAALLCEANPPARAAAGFQHSLFIDGEGRLSSCGYDMGYYSLYNHDEGLLHVVPGFLGQGEGVTRLNTPTRLPPLGGKRAVSVAAGTAHSLALTADGAVWSWGYGGERRLGHGDTQNQLQPKKIEAFARRRRLAAWRRRHQSFADGASGVVALSAGTSHSLALTADGALWSWGDGACGRLGHGDQQEQLLPKKVEALAGQRVVAVSAGGGHNLAITGDGAVWSWGYGSSRQLGHGDTLNQYGEAHGQSQWLPKKVEALAGRRVIAVSAGSGYSLALTADGSVWSWGYGGGQLGHGDHQRQPLPKKVEALAGQRVVAVSAGAQHSLALAANGAVWSWGSGTFGRLGHGDEQLQLLPKKVDAFAEQRVVAVSTGCDHSLALTADGAVFTWGKGDHSCLGHGEDLSNQLLPKKIEAWGAGQ